MTPADPHQVTAVWGDLRVGEEVAAEAPAADQHVDGAAGTRGSRFHRDRDQFGNRVALVHRTFADGEETTMSGVPPEVGEGTVVVRLERDLGSVSGASELLR